MEHRLQIGSTETVTYRSRPGPMWFQAGTWILFGLVLFGGSLAALNGVPLYSFITLPPGGATGAAVGGILGGGTLMMRGALVWLREWRGKNGLTITARGVRFTALSTKWADWDSVTDFVVEDPPVSRGAKRVGAKAGIVGARVSGWVRQEGAFVIPDVFPQPLTEIAARLNELRPQTAANDAAAAVPIAAAPIPRQPFKASKWLIILIVLAIAVHFFAGTKLPTSGLATLIAFLAVQPFLRKGSKARQH